MYAVVERRPWLPRYRVVIMNASGKMIQTRTFWRVKSARGWAHSHAYATYQRRE